ncbi:MmcQ/YjbR family DNA-binding protein [Photobacterium sp. CCB-ST2H9]|uniref:MmcQ/YjbR family DNA-binding protein n=1 Tax=unclassified Photobacterium TaxID=2628852 RepID=UPI0020042D9B|nr:MmcQ/YjbR family DNA-binding protein [Photobacterium sp. CCB-ST2H9]UTM55897.1 MmcQ/YjbR family DNA-binding protein [Photobacterium sp. CCB-ST2H9]
MKSTNDWAAFIDQHLLSQPGAVIDYPFGPEPTVYKVAGKMFAWVAVRENIPVLTVKATPADVEFLVGEFPSITPGYHMNKRHWITVRMDGQIQSGMLEQLASASYQLVVSGLSKAQQNTLKLK